LEACNILTPGDIVFRKLGWFPLSGPNAGPLPGSEFSCLISSATAGIWVPDAAIFLMGHPCRVIFEILHWPVICQQHLAEMPPLQSPQIAIQVSKFP